ncbi:MAG: ArsR/SmtB family transcription factor [Chloroflexota bacterium]
MEQLLGGLRAAGEPTRLRLLALCARAELTVTELTKVLGQSQPRVSRHLKLLCDAGLLTRFREGQWAFYRISDDSPLARTIVELVPEDDPELSRDLERLEEIRLERAETAAQYFRENAERWDEIRSMYVPERDVERAMLDILKQEPISDLLDVGTGTGRILEIMAPHIKRGLGIDSSHEMLSMARVNLSKPGLEHCRVRHGDMYALPAQAQSMDAVVFHQVLHFTQNPQAAIAEAARVLRPGGRVMIVDFAPHSQEFLREQHAHRRLGLPHEEMEAWCERAGLTCELSAVLKGDPLTVNVWLARPLAAGKKAELTAIGASHAS